MSSAACPSAAPDDVLVRREDGVLIVTINRPGQRNAVNGAVSAGIARALDLLDSASDLRVGVLHGAGPAFCAGMDLTAFADGEQVRDPARGFGGIVERPPAKPLIAAVEGWALGGGFEIVLACDMVTAGKGARFGLPEVRRGLAAAREILQRRCRGVSAASWDGCRPRHIPPVACGRRSACLSGDRPRCPGVECQPRGCGLLFRSQQLDCSRCCVTPIQTICRTLAHGEAAHQRNSRP